MRWTLKPFGVVQRGGDSEGHAARWRKRTKRKQNASIPKDFYNVRGQEEKWLGWGLFPEPQKSLPLPTLGFRFPAFRTD